MDRREFLRRSALAGGAAYLGSRVPWALAGAGEGVSGVPQGSLLAHPAAESPIDTIVVVMMENRSIDHYLGWLANDAGFVERGRSKYGAGFGFDGLQDQTFLDSGGATHGTYHLLDPEKNGGEENPYRGCGHPDPGHGWNSGRVQHNGGANDGFMKNGSGNDRFAIGYYEADDLPVYATLAKRFTTFDNYFCSVLTSTFPNREYMHSAQSGGISTNALPPEVGGEHTFGFTWDTIWDRLRDDAGFVPGKDAGYFFVDLPAIALWGARMAPFTQHLEDYFARAATGTLPKVTFVDPGFTTGLRTDDHPYADIRAGQKLVGDVVKAFVESPHWHSGALFITYDEWGGFFDHVPPPVLPDLYAAQGFGQAGFRVPTMMASPYAKPGFVDSSQYDHTSILRFIEWRYLGAPAHGPDKMPGSSADWWLTPRDRHAANIGASLGFESPNPEFHAPLLPEVPIASAPCHGEELEGAFVDGPINQVREPAEEQLENVLEQLEPHAFEKAQRAGYYEHIGWTIDLKPLPTL